MPAARVSGTVRSKNPLKGAVEVLPERLYYAALKTPPPSMNILASTPKRKKDGTPIPNRSSSSSNNNGGINNGNIDDATTSGNTTVTGMSTATATSEKKQIHFFNIDNELIYWNFFLDFGPLNLGQLIRFCNKLNEKLKKYQAVCYYSNTVPAKRANAIFLICAYQMLYLHRTPEQSYAGFDHEVLHAVQEERRQQQEQEQQRRRREMENGRHVVMDEDDDDDAGGDENSEHARYDDDNNNDVPNNNSGVDDDDCLSHRRRLNYSLPPVSNSQGSITVATLPPFHDASPCACTYDVTVLDSLRGMRRAMECNFFSLDQFDVDEYEYYEQVENGDLNWIARDKILAFAGPSYERHVSPEGYCTLSPSDYIPYFVRKNVSLVVRLNKKAYNEQDFVNANINHVEAFFTDGSCPPMKILKGVLDAFESVPRNKAFAVHCKAGLGRTGTCIGAYLMKHFHFTALEAIGWMRVCRPGCVIGPQQHFLQKLQPLMWQEGAILRNGGVERPLQQQESSMMTKKSGSNATKKIDPTGGAGGVDPVMMTDIPDAVTGRAGQAAGLLAARGKRTGGNSTSNGSRRVSSDGVGASSSGEQQQQQTKLASSLDPPPSTTTTTTTTDHTTPPVTPDHGGGGLGGSSRGVGTSKGHHNDSNNKKPVAVTPDSATSSAHPRLWCP